MIFHVISDTHCENHNFAAALKDIAAICPQSAGIIIPGDFSGEGTCEEFEGFYKALSSCNPTPNAMVSLGNHEYQYYETERNPKPFSELLALYYRYNGRYMEDISKPYFDKWIDGYHFIILNSEAAVHDAAYLSPEQINWLENTVCIDAEPHKPIFAVIHQAVSGTHTRSDKWAIGKQEIQVKKILKQYPQTVLFSGHIHNGFGAATVIKTSFGTMVDVPSFSYNELGLLKGGTGYQAEVTKGRVYLRARDFIQGEWLEQYDKEIFL